MTPHRLQFLRECEKCAETKDIFFFREETVICSGCMDQQRVARAKNAFHNSIWNIFGGRTLGEYRGCGTLVSCECPEGHKCSSHPGNIQQGGGMCRICARNDPTEAEKNFRKAITDMGGKVLGEYQGKDVPVCCECAEGHKCNPRPGGVQQGRGMCRVCAGNDPAETETNFRKTISDRGGKVLGEYQGNNVSVLCECPKGHKCSPSPNHIRQGSGMCRICAKCDPAEAEKNFRKDITDMGGKVLGEYHGANVPVSCECPKGHKGNPTPHSIQQGGGMCRVCAGCDPAEAEKNFRKAITDMGGKILGEYQRASVPVSCECSEGHKCSPRPNAIQQGQGMCSSCGFKSEPMCRKIFEEILGFEMSKIRPDWLSWKNSRPLELDGYNEENMIAFEYQGIQHDKYIDYFHRNGIQDFEAQIERDIFKVQTCFDRGVKLILVPCIYTYRNPEAMREYIIAELEAL